MNTETWRQANALFEQALDVPADERAAWLERVCAHQPGLRAEVEQRLRTDAEAEADGFLARPLVPIPEPADQVFPTTPSGAPMPTRFGPYRVLHEVGRGGMGTVYAAERDDDAFERPVAIKVISSNTASDDVARRLRSERRILALLEHRYIARMYDGGTLPDGRPYFVMELVSGLPIDAYCARHELSVRQRVALMRQVGLAVDYAHRNLVVHRDLKPSNILVTEDGDVKLLDFGIAKLLEADQPTPVDVTVPWRQHLTLHYASPEQLRGQPVSTASDVYALGVLLYRLLTGTMPRSFDDASPWQAEQDIVSSDATRPSRAAAQGDRSMRPPGDDQPLGRQLAGDLDAIVLKALRADPGDRYRSAGHLVDDLDRYRNGQPVAARRGTLRYRFGKLLGRNRLATALATVVLTLGIAFIVTTMISAHRLAAKQASQDATLKLLLGMFEEAGPYAAEGKALTLREAVDRQADRLDEPSLEHQPAVAAQVHSTLGWLYLQLGVLERARTHHERALDLHRRLDPNGTEVAASMDGVAATLREQGALDQAEALSAEALARHRRAGSPPENLLRSLNERVALFCWREDYAAADAPSAEALRLAQQASEAEAEAESETTKAMVQRAAVLRGLGRSEEARQRYLDTEAVLVHRYGPNYPTLAALYNNLANIEVDAGRAAQAVDYWRRADAQYVEAFGEDFYDRVIALTNMGRQFVANGDHAAAEAALRTAVAVAGRSPDLGPEHQPLYAGRPAIVLGSLLIDNDRCQEAVTLLRPLAETWASLDSASATRAVDAIRALVARCELPNRQT